MPLYPYRCTACGHQFEKVQKFSDAPETVCPQCGGRVERQMSAPALQFKGAGWYINDYSAKPSSSTAGKPAASDSSSAASSAPAAPAPAASSKE